MGYFTCTVHVNARVCEGFPATSLTHTATRGVCVSTNGPNTMAMVPFVIAVELATPSTVYHTRSQPEANPLLSLSSLHDTHSSTNCDLTTAGGMLPHNSETVGGTVSTCMDNSSRTLSVVTAMPLTPLLSCSVQFKRMHPVPHDGTSLVMGRDSVYRPPPISMKPFVTSMPPSVQGALGATINCVSLCAASIVTVSVWFRRSVCADGDTRQLTIQGTSLTAITRSAGSAANLIPHSDGLLMCDITDPSG